MPETGAYSESPFKFLEAYRKEDAGSFFGRESEVRELFERIYLGSIILLYGGSGTGKSSLIRCGLANQFEDTDWLPIYVRRNGHMLTALNKALRRHALSEMSMELSLEDKIRSLYLDYFQPIYLIFDQFEEIFIQGDTEEQEAFFHAMAHLLRTSDRCKIIISMREEYLAHLSDFEMVIPNLFANRQRLEPMSRMQLRRVIEGNTALNDIELEDGVNTADLIIDQLRNEKGEVELPYLQIYLDRLYQQAVRQKKDNGGYLVFTTEGVRQARGLKDVLSDFLTEQISALENELEQEGLRQKGLPLAVLFSLVTGERTRKSEAVDHIRRDMQRRMKVDPIYVDYCVQRLITMRILTFKE